MQVDDSTIISKELGLVEVDPDLSMVDEALNLDIRQLDSISDVMITKYMASLTQYNIYLQTTYNKYYMLKKKYERVLEIRLKIYADKNKLKKTTKKDLRIEACINDNDIARISTDLDTAIHKVTVLEGITKYIDSYVNALKKDLVRRRIEIG